MKVVKGIGLVLVIILVLLTLFHWVSGAGFGDAFGMTTNDVKVAIRYPNKPRTVWVFVRRSPFFDKMMSAFSPFTDNWINEIGDMPPEQLERLLESP